MNSRVLRFRLSDAEYVQLQQRAAQDEETVSGVIREALYAKYGIGSLSTSSIVAEPSSHGCRTPRE
jgi:hypothetical protein